MTSKNPKNMDPKHHNSTPEERDERFSLYGLDPEKVIEAVLQTKPDEDAVTKPRKPKQRGKIAT